MSRKYVVGDSLSLCCSCHQCCHSNHSFLACALFFRCQLALLATFTRCASSTTIRAISLGGSATRFVARILIRASCGVCASRAGVDYLGREQIGPAQLEKWQGVLVTWVVLLNRGVAHGCHPVEHSRVWPEGMLPLRAAYLLVTCTAFRRHRVSSRSPILCA